MLPEEWLSLLKLCLHLPQEARSDEFPLNRHSHSNCLEKESVWTFSWLSRLHVLTLQISASRPSCDDPDNCSTPGFGFVPNHKTFPESMTVLLFIRTAACDSDGQGWFNLPSVTVSLLQLGVDINKTLFLTSGWRQQPNIPPWRLSSWMEVMSDFNHCQLVAGYVLSHSGPDWNSTLIWYWNRTHIDVVCSDFPHDVFCSSGHIFYLSVLSFFNSRNFYVPNWSDQLLIWQLTLCHAILQQSQSA